ncbi:MAG: ATP phosphoribosyltransferase [Candidatus Marinimicrobia bacterium]|jgi:ATP phosphoribosyltransferase|nr:ATP phosphoribosyltransferase [Candidatus Neomarinimicrobiota bacterium]MDP6455908.1 ATP phosphoribosyltransferase [Candidatus Neomarinimicrobiota bacterium]MDP6592972.1 ATP phosphoribosyltransferase [Candidatus Neomarinimicrobiota bacterium]MDP6835942.1 ATP phosphoribosyltransferase [Candidatus Neomarinimicrobiota bacterium]MDP6965973.1 ATP phosphoribosyltransferase [Candidatus Neomarinimicrobiota bacterium]|tara:strand:- start:12435 stop:13310 length:876 start_codon:yes stop_codon:yes gene_type:complete
MNQVLNLGLPKGSLQESTFSLLKRAGWNFVVSARAYKPYCDDPEMEALLIRAQEMSAYVEQGIFDVGITGLDWVVENGSDVVEVCELVYAKSYMRTVRWVLAVPEDSAVKTVHDLHGKHISTEVVNITKDYLAHYDVTAEVEFSWGATEVKPGLLTDAIVEVTETGTSLRANKLRVVDTVMESSTRLIANKEAYEDQWKKGKIDNIARLLQSSIVAASRVGLKMNVTNENLQAIIDVLPAMKTPTVSPLYNGSGAAVEVIVEEETVRDIIPCLVEMGATDIIEYPLNKVIP